MTVPMIGACLR